MARCIDRKPPLGARPAWLVAWDRIGELAEGIERQYQASDGDIETVLLYAGEIQAQCLIIQRYGRKPSYATEAEKHS